MSSADEDTYKCFAANKYGKAVCTATLTVTGGEELTQNNSFNLNIGFQVQFNLILKYKPIPVKLR